MSLAGKTLVVTGGSRRIGLAIARRPAPRRRQRRHPTSGDSFIDDALHAELGVADLARYSVAPGAPYLIPDFFVD